MRTKQTELALALRADRTALGAALMESIAGWDKYAHGFVDDAEARQEFIKQEMVGFVDYLAIYFETGDVSYRDLYIGEKLKQCHDPRESAEASAARKQQITSSDREIYASQLQGKLQAAPMTALLETLDAIHRIVNDPGRMTMRVLLVGDCLHLDVVAFLTAPLLESGIRLECSFATSKNPMELHRSLSELRERQFDLVFYSPFSYAMDLEYSQFVLLRTAMAGRSKWRTIVESAKTSSASTMKLLGELFEAPIVVHNSANIRRHDRSALERFKNAATYAGRRFSRQLVNAWLPGQLEQLNATTFRHFFLLDETALFRKQSEDQLGSLFYDSDLQHPAEFGRGVASMYQDLAVTQALYAKKKVIVCDLDNTLWAGVIGEGAVSHFADRQATLKALRNKGILLAINSKNDPKNIHWSGSVLSEDDFVSAQVNWDSKVQNLRRIASDLNLKLKDFLFVDDRADERAMVGEMLPEVETLDAESADVWRRLALLAELLPEQDELDRTLAYKQREQRQSFLEDPETAEAEQRELFRKMELTVTIRVAQQKELKRVAELINRTNQFNMCGSRTTLREVTEWHDNPRHSVFVVDAGDRFGTMGVVSIAIVAETAEAFEIPVFVLSCRVFGYGVEKALLNHVRRMASDVGKPILGLYAETAYNEPCRKAYPDAGFVWEERVWVHRGDGAVEDPDWLTIQAPQLVSPQLASLSS